MCGLYSLLGLSNIPPHLPATGNAANGDLYLRWVRTYSGKIYRWPVGQCLMPIVKKPTVGLWLRYVITAIKKSCIKWHIHGWLNPCWSWERVEQIHHQCHYLIFLHDRPWLSLWIKSICTELDAITHVIASQLSGYNDVTSNRLWRYQQNVNRASEARGRCPKIVVSYRHLWIGYVV